ncbi:hypothetical protein ACFOSS_05175 [Pseudaeromonas sharmana]|uniref:Zinc ribbon domain-containing protein n=1 Tax=Pseudaeromonas sharmana TaxID=328412 RepID=A0ABV8CLQ8_9GAMM
MIDWFQSLQIEQNERDIAQNKSAQRNSEGHLGVLEEKIDSLYIMTLAALELLHEQGVTKMQIMNKIEEIDLRDGKVDGKLAQPTQCPDCGHRISKRRSNCFYCGARINGLSFNR